MTAASSLLKNTNREPAPEARGAGMEPGAPPGRSAASILKSGTPGIEAVPFQLATLTAETHPPEQPEAPPSDDPEEAAPLADRLAEEAEVRHQAELEAAKREAYERGLAAGKSAAGEEIAALRDHVEAINAELQSSWQHFLGEAERELAAFSIQVAEHVLGLPLPEDLSAQIRHAMVDTVHQLSEGGTTEVQLHPVDYLKLKEAVVIDQIGAENARIFWHPDASLKPGEWVVSTANVSVRRILAEMIDDIRQMSPFENQSP